MLEAERVTRLTTRDTTRDRETGVRGPGPNVPSLRRPGRRLSEERRGRETFSRFYSLTKGERWRGVELVND